MSLALLQTCKLLTLLAASLYGVYRAVIAGGNLILLPNHGAQSVQGGEKCYG